MRQIIGIFSVAIAVAILSPRPAAAIPQFQKEYLALYEESPIAEAAKKAKCFNCHQGKKSKKNRNAYGVELSKLLDKKKDKKEKEKIIEALKKVGEMHTVEGDDSSPTYAELIADGKLPGGTVEDSMKEPAEE